MFFEDSGRLYRLECLKKVGDYLRQNDLEIWDKNDERTLKTRSYCISNDEPRTFVAKCRERSNETVANIMLTQIRQINTMLANLLKKLEAEFVDQGGIKEVMTNARRKNRGY